MPIQVLPPQLANQIAAGEVVERPRRSSGAGGKQPGRRATRIDIDIERGGAAYLAFATMAAASARTIWHWRLARHATSKISTLDDLEAIVSLGFAAKRWPVSALVSV